MNELTHLFSTLIQRIRSTGEEIFEILRDEYPLLKVYVLYYEEKSVYAHFDKDKAFTRFETFTSVFFDDDALLKEYTFEEIFSMGSFNNELILEQLFWILKNEFSFPFEICFVECHDYYLEGNRIIKRKYDPFRINEHGIGIITKGDKFGLCDDNGLVTIDFIYDHITSFNKDGIARVTKNQKYGLINTNGEIILPIDFTYIDFSESNLHYAVKGEVCGFINTRGLFIYTIICPYYVFSPDAINKKKGFIQTTDLDDRVITFPIIHHTASMLPIHDLARIN